MKYYASPLAHRPISFGGGKVFTFEIVGLSGGRATGVFKTEDAAEVAILDGAVQGRRGVKEITADEYADALKKKNSIQRYNNSNAFKPRVAQTPKLLPDMPLVGNGSADSAAGAKGNVATPAQVDLHKPEKPSVKDLVKIERVNPPQPFAGAAEATVKAVKRADTKRARVIRQAVG